MKGKADYTYLDMLIQERIASGSKYFNQIDGGPVHEEAENLADKHGGLAFRYVDRRLQALRKSGLIKYTTTEKWTVNHE